MFLFRDSKYTKAYPAGPVTLPPGSALHVGVSVKESGSRRDALVLDHCYATPSSNPDDKMKHFFIHNM